MGRTAGCVSIRNNHVGWELRAGLNIVSLVVAVQQCLDRVNESLPWRFPKRPILITEQFNSSLLLTVTHAIKPGSSLIHPAARTQIETDLHLNKVDFYKQNTRKKKPTLQHDCLRTEQSFQKALVSLQRLMGFYGKVYISGRLLCNESHGMVEDW